MTTDMSVIKTRSRTQLHCIAYPPNPLGGPYIDQGDLAKHPPISSRSVAAAFHDPKLGVSGVLFLQRRPEEKMTGITRNVPRDRDRARAPIAAAALFLHSNVFPPSRPSIAAALEVVQISVSRNP